MSIGRALARPHDLDSLFETLQRELASIVDATIVILGLYDAPNGTIHVVKQLYDGRETPGGSFPLGSGITSQAIRTGLPSLIRRWSVDGPPARLRYSADGGQLPESAATVPLLWDDRPIGVLLLQSYRAEAYDEDDLLLLQAVGSFLAAALQGLTGSERLDALLGRRVSELEAVLASMADALVVVDADGCVVRLNAAARELLGVDDTGMVLGQPLDGPNWDDRPYGPRAIAQALAPAVAALRHGLPLRDKEAELGTPGERRRVISFSCAPLRDPTGAPAGGVLVFRDVTGHREVQRLKDEVLSIASHDLRSPLAGIRARAQLARQAIESGKAIPQRLAEHMGMIEDQVDRLVGLLGLLLDFSRLESGRLQLEPTPFDLVALAGMVAAEVQAGTERHTIGLAAPRAVEGAWDERRMEQVLRNLVANAVKYSPEGGAITVSIEADDEEVRVQVKDEGLGIAAEELPHVFDRFYRAQSTRRLEGSGLGLYICRAIVGAHGGRIWAESQGVGQGSTFAFTVPRSPI